MEAKEGTGLVRIAELALHLGRRCLRSYGSVKSRHDFTQPQLMACLILKVATRSDYRGITELLTLAPALRECLGLEKVPHYTTLQKFAAREGVDAALHGMLDELLKHVGLHGQEVQVAADSTGLQSGLASEHYRTRRWGAGTARRYVKVSAMVICGAILPAGLVVDVGPSNDMRQVERLLTQAGERTRPSLLVADRGYDAEWVHAHCRERWQAQCVIPVRQEPGKQVRSRYRAQQGVSLPKVYGKRWQAESFFSGLKRTMLSTLAARSVAASITEATLKVVTYAIRR